MSAPVVAGTANLSLVGSVDEAFLSTTLLPVGSDVVTATYQGDSTFTSSSATVTQNVQSWSMTMPSSSSVNVEYAQTLGEASINLYSGAAQVSQPLDFTRSDGARGQQMFGLSYNSSAAHPELVLLETLTPNSLAGLLLAELSACPMAEGPARQ